MSQSDGDQQAARSHIEHNRHQQARESYWDRQERIRDSVTKCARALEHGRAKHYYFIANELHETLVPLLLEANGETPRTYADRLADHEDWHYVALKRFVNDPTAFLAPLHPETPAPSADEVGARTTVKNAFHACAAIAEAQEVIREELRTRVDASVFGTKIGEHLQDAEMDLGESVEALSLLSGALKTIHTGGTGQGKSAGVETEAMAYYWQNYREGRDFKLIDAVGLRDGENWFPDIPQHDPTMRRSREEQGEPPSFAEDPDRPPEEYPDVEILVPLSPGLTQQELPYATGDGEFVVRPFTIPASAIRKRLLIAIMATKLTPEQENAVRSAYNEIDNQHDDWQLSDLADEVRSRDELSEQKARPIVSTLRELQAEGFIRTHDDEYTLDWRSIMADNETITIFSQSFLDDEIAKLICVGHLAETIVSTREQMYGVSECLLPLREMWKVAPHNRRQSFDARAAALQEAIGHMLTELFRENRHSGVHLSCDTQYLSDLLKAIREMFNRYVVYNTDRDTVKEVFEWTANDKWKSFYATLSPQPGEASIVGMVGPAIDERDIEFIGPIQYTGPGHHHFDEGRDQTGWHARVDYLTPDETCPKCDGETIDRGDDLVSMTCPDCGHEWTDLSMGRNEELKTPAEMGVMWDDEVPKHLTINTGFDDEDGSPDVDYQPVAAFAERCLAHQPGAKVKREHVRMAFNAFMTDHDREGRDFDEPGVANSFGRRLSEVLDYSDALSRTKIDGDSADKGLALTSTGERYLEDALGGLEDAAAPVTDR